MIEVQPFLSLSCKDLPGCVNSNCYLVVKIRTFLFFIWTSEAAESLFGDCGDCNCAASKTVLNSGEIRLKQTVLRTRCSWSTKSSACRQSPARRSFSCGFKMQLFNLLSIDCLVVIFPLSRCACCVWLNTLITVRAQLSLSFQRVIWVGDTHTFRLSHNKLDLVEMLFFTTGPVWFRSPPPHAVYH